MIEKFGDTDPRRGKSSTRLYAIRRQLLPRAPRDAKACQVWPRAAKCSKRCPKAASRARRQEQTNAAKCCQRQGQVSSGGRGDQRRSVRKRSVSLTPSGGETKGLLRGSAACGPFTSKDTESLISQKALTHRRDKLQNFGQWRVPCLKAPTHWSNSGLLRSREFLVLAKKRQVLNGSYEDFLSAVFTQPLSRGGAQLKLMTASVVRDNGFVTFVLDSLKVCTVILFGSILA